MRPNGRRGILVALALALCASSTSASDPSDGTLPTARCQIGEAPPTIAVEQPILQRDTADLSRENLEAWLRVLTAPERGGREACTAQSAGVARLLAQYFEDLGLNPLDDGYCQPFTASDCTDQNVAGLLGNAEADATRPVVIVGAHYDSQGVSWDGAVYPGADDNASGVAVLAEVARLLAERQEPLAADVLFVAFGAEERRLLGSAHFVANPPLPLERVSLMINLDMVGRPLLEDNFLRLVVPSPDETIGYVVGERDFDSTLRLLRRAREAAGVDVYGIPESLLATFGFLSDSSSFSSVAPTLFLSTSIHDDYHQVSDTLDRVDREQMLRAARLVLAVLTALEVR